MEFAMEVTEEFDITILMQIMDEIKESVSLVNVTFTNQPLVFVNHAFESVTGYKKHEVIGKNCRFLQGNLPKQPQLNEVRRAIAKGEKCSVVLKNLKKDGTLFWNQLDLTPIVDSRGKLCFYMGIQKDITNDIGQKVMDTYLSDYDPLTGAYNDHGFYKTINEVIHEKAENHLNITIGVADIDFFKQFNESYGRVKGDEILKILGTEILSEFNGDIIGRFGGDKFYFSIFTEEKSPDFFYKKVSNALHSLNATLSQPFQISVSAGAVLEKATVPARVDQLILLAESICNDNRQFSRLNLLNP